MRFRTKKPIWHRRLDKKSGFPEDLLEGGDGVPPTGKPCPPKPEKNGAEENLPTIPAEKLEPRPLNEPENLPPSGEKQERNRTGGGTFPLESQEDTTSSQGEGGITESKSSEDSPGSSRRFFSHAHSYQEKGTAKQRLERLKSSAFCPVLAPESPESGRKPASSTLRYAIWRYFMLFIIVILVLLWTFQITALQFNYQQMKIRDIRKAAATILENMDSTEYRNVYDSLAIENTMCIEIVNLNNMPIYSSPEMMGGYCAIHGINRVNLSEYEQSISNSKSGVQLYKLYNKWYKSQTLLFGMRIGTAEAPQGFLFLNTSIDPLDSTVAILQEQLLYITLSLLFIGLVISFFMARNIAKPIVNITNKAEKLGQGDFDVKFDGSGYEEAERLASTLNYASAEISKVDHLRKDLIANISHDLRTPLTMVKAYAEMIRDLSGDHPEKRNKHINIIIEESDRLSGLVSDLLDLSKLESGNMPLEKTNFGISAKLREILNRYTVLSEQKGYQFQLELDEEREVQADVKRVEQVLYNLINNAVNYTGEDKTVIIRQINKPGSVRVEIMDHGPGIPPEQLPLIFDRYYRTEKSKREVIGSGLGLSIVKNILKQHGYPFGVQSEEGKGSVFWFEILM